MKKVKFSQHELQKQVCYDSGSGLFYSLRKTKNTDVGGVVSCRSPSGYFRVNVFGQRFPAHRLAWFYVFGEWPEHEIDHIDGNPSNNALSNLRSIKHSENLQNIRKPRKNSKTGVNGVSWNAHRQAFIVQLVHLGSNKHGGQFRSLDDAIVALKKLKAVWHPFSPYNETK